MPAGAAAVITAIGGAIGASGLVGSGKVRDFVTGVAKKPEPPKPKFDAPVIISIVVGAFGLIIGLITLTRK
jgi:F0F1-type ATP synthase membrane subunit c/vacuolar-type H+-ATPase subunit K